MSGLAMLGAREPSHRQPGELRRSHHAALAISIPNARAGLHCPVSAPTGVPCNLASIFAGPFFDKPALINPSPDRAAGIVSVWAEAAGVALCPNRGDSKFSAKRNEPGSHALRGNTQGNEVTLPHAPHDGETDGREVHQSVSGRKENGLRLAR